MGKLIRRDLIQCKSVDTLPDGVAEKSEALLTELSRAFDPLDKKDDLAQEVCPKLSYRWSNEVALVC